MFRTRKIFFGPVLVMVFFFEGCIGSRLGSANKGEELKMTISEKKDIVNFNALKEQPTVSLAARGKKSRGLDISPVVGSVVSIATDAIKKVIANEQKKYTAVYPFALTDLYFYDQMSNESPFDPVGMQFAGFKIKRTFINKNGNIDTAFMASFSLDTSNAYEILNNSMFRLRLDDFTLKYAKAKVAGAGDQKLNMDIEITFRSSYVNQDGVLFDNVTLGTFYLFIRDAPLDPAAPNHDSYYNELKGKLLTGKSFLVPRSFGYHMEEDQAKPGFSQGAYTIDIQVKESSKDHFISKMISENAGLLIDAYREKAIEAIDKKLPGN
jgi:hypothetical protein